MIDESNEELASLYVLDLLEGLEKQGFETLMAREPELRQLVTELREAAAPMALLTPPVAPPPELKARLLAEIGAPQRQARKEATIVAFPSWIPWAMAACFALALAWTGKLYFSSRFEAVSNREQLAAADIALRSAQQQLEAERIVTKQQIAGLNQQVADASRQLADLRQNSGGREQTLTTAMQQLATARRQLDDANQKVALLNQQLEASTKLSAESGRRASELEQLLLTARDQIATLDQQMKIEGNLANLRIAKLASMLKNSPQALAIAVWSPIKQEGLFTVEKLPVPKSDQDYELWVIDPTKSAPVSAGIFEVGPDGVARVHFKTEAPIETVAKFAVSREKKGGAPAGGGPKGDVIMASP